jgi:hypothetical protein
MALTPNVIANAPILSTWGNEVRDRSVQVFATSAERASQWPAPPTGATSYLVATPGVLYVWNGGAWVVGGGAGSLIVKKRTLGDLTVGTAGFTNWSDFDAGTFATSMPAAVGDVLSVTLDGAWGTVAGGVGFLDAYFFTSGAPFGASAGGSPTGNGVVGWGGHAVAGNDPFNGTAFRTVVAGDIASGAVAIRLRARTGGGNQVLWGSAVSPLTMTTRNLGPAI